MVLLNKSLTNPVKRPIKVLQFGEGGFLRAFVDYMIDVANEKGNFNGDIVIVKPIEFGNLDFFKEQDCQYTLTMSGMENGKEKTITRVITSVADAVAAVEEYDRFMEYAKTEDLRFIVSNTTEAGIVFSADDKFEMCPPATFPGKLTKFMYERYKWCNGDNSMGLVLLPVELIDNNGKELKRCVFEYIDLWGLEEGFKTWLDEACVFASTLVDRIVTGYPRETAEEMWDELGYRDNLLDTCELFALWVIESDKDISDEFPLDKAGMPVVFTNNLKPYKKRKVRILNGAHTSFVLASFLAGNDYVIESMNDRDVSQYMKDTIFNEVIPSLPTRNDNSYTDFAESVIERFEHPYMKHRLLSISLNSVSKWRARCMPSLKSYIIKEGKLPKHLVFSLASLMQFYTGTEIRNGALIGHRMGDEEYEVMDDMNVLEFFAEKSTTLPEAQFVQEFLSNEDFFGEDLTKFDGVAEGVTEYLIKIRTLGVREAMQQVFGEN